MNGRAVSLKFITSDFRPRYFSVSTITTFHSFVVSKKWEYASLHWQLRGRSCSCAAHSDRNISNYTEKGSYITLSGKVHKELEVKRSKFMAVAAPIEDESAALRFLSTVFDSRATHNCWAYKVSDRHRFNDDGEPGGTAGRPIYSAIEASGLDHVVLVVTRYFGGTKLGTGGLVRAYRKVALDCLTSAATSVVKAKILVTFSMPYEFVGVVYPLLQVHAIQKIDEQYYDANSIVLVKVFVEVEKENLLRQRISDACRGRARFT